MESMCGKKGAKECLVIRRADCGKHTDDHPTSNLLPIFQPESLIVWNRVLCNECQLGCGGERGKVTSRIGMELGKKTKR